MSTHIDELSREAYCVLGVPIDVIEMSSVLRDIEAAAASRSPLFISTPNLNFLVKSQQIPISGDRCFRAIFVRRTGYWLFGLQGPSAFRSKAKSLVRIFLLRSRPAMALESH